jgi:hypothetical protein
MRLRRRQVLSIKRVIVVAARVLLLGIATFAYGVDGTSANPVRHVKGRTIFSEESPS